MGALSLKYFVSCYYITMVKISQTKVARSVMIRHQNGFLCASNFGFALMVNITIIKMKVIMSLKNVQM